MNTSKPKKFLPSKNTAVIGLCKVFSTEQNHSPSSPIIMTKACRYAASDRSSSCTRDIILPRRACRWTLLLTIWIMQSIILLLPDGADAFQMFRPGTTQGNNLRMYQSRPALEDYPISDFQKRLLNRMNTNNGTRNIKSQSSISKSHVQCPYIQEVRTLKEYKRVIVDENKDGQLVVVWFYSPWCRSCKGVSKGFQALSREYHKDVKFVQVPVLSENATLHQGLGVKSVPFVHVYHPTEGLVEEQKLTRKFLLGFHRLLKDYISEECSLEQFGIGNDKTWSTDSPYDHVSKYLDTEEETLLDD